jgi:FimV-like protein
MRSSLASTSTPLLASESRSDSNGTSEDEIVAEPAEETVARLEIVPASEEDLAGGEPGTGAVPGGEGSDEVEGDVREELARTEEALISAQQENTYLQERISELEAQLAETAGVSEGTVADEELSNLEDRLQAERLAEAAATEEEETDSRIPSVTTTSSGEEDAPWYSGPMTWIIMVIIVIAAVIGWIFNRRRNGEQFATDSGESTVAASGLKGEAEEILRTLDADAGVDQADDDTVVSAPVSRDDAEEETTPDSKDDDAESGQREVVEHKEEAQVEPIIPMGSIRPRRRDDEIDATVLDENSSDPEIKLDLARAYISMGDKEAARAILDEVLNMGNKQQQAEARSMMDEI